MKEKSKPAKKSAVLGFLNIPSETKPIEEEVPEVDETKLEVIITKDVDGRKILRPLRDQQGRDPLESQTIATLMVVEILGIDPPDVVRLESEERRITEMRNKVISQLRGMG